jgi:hypothetical protein
MDIHITNLLTSFETVTIPEEIGERCIPISYVVTAKIKTIKGVDIEGDFSFKAEDFEPSFEHAEMRIRELFNL